MFFLLSKVASLVGWIQVGVWSVEVMRAAIQSRCTGPLVSRQEARGGVEREREACCKVLAPSSVVRSRIWLAVAVAGRSEGRGTGHERGEFVQEAWRITWSEGKREKEMMLVSAGSTLE